MTTFKKYAMGNMFARVVACIDLLNRVIVLTALPVLAITRFWVYTLVMSVNSEMLPIKSSLK